MTDDLAHGMEHDWEAECRGLGYMILDIAEKYEQARLTGGDNELLASAIQQARDWVNGPLRERLGPWKLVEEVQ